jgi:hypothetical protein
MNRNSLRFTALLIAALLIAPAPAGVASTKCDTSSSPAPTYKQVDQVGNKLVTKYLQLLQKQDTKGLQGFLSPAFNLQRADGTGFGKVAYLKALPIIQKFTISELHASQSQGFISVRYLLNADGKTADKNYSPGPAPRISTFSWNGCSWQISSHANFNAMTPSPIAGINSLLNKQTTTVLGQPFQYLTSSAEVTSSILTMVPGQETGRHRHDAPLYVYVLSGEVTVTYDGGIVKKYTEGMALLEAVGVYHNGVNTGTDPVRLLIVNMGAAGVANTVTL